VLIGVALSSFRPREPLHFARSADSTGDVDDGNPLSSISFEGSDGDAEASEETPTRDDDDVGGDDRYLVGRGSGCFPGFYGLEPIVEENSDDMRTNTDDDTEFSSFCSTSTTERGRDQCVTEGREARVELRRPTCGWTKSELYYLKICYSIS
jgi:hypothetical protein